MSGAAGIIVAPVEVTSSFLRGSFYGPQAVADELGRLEPFDPDLGLVAELEQPETVLIGERGFLLDDALDEIEAVAGAWLDEGRFVLTLGGEHTVSLGALRAATRRSSELGVVQLDAHGDLRDLFEDRTVSHACVMRRAVDDLGVHLLGLGIRSICAEEAAVVRSHPRITHLSTSQIDDLDAVSAAIDALPPQVYLTVDIDGFDPTVAPGVGTPEPGGFSWRQAAGVIDLVCQRRQVIAGDIVELAPTIERPRTVRLAARVALRVLLRSEGGLLTRCGSGDQASPEAVAPAR